MNIGLANRLVAIGGFRHDHERPALGDESSKTLTKQWMIIYDEYTLL